MMKKTALIWGATGGIGRAITQLLREADWDVVAVGRDVLTLEDMATLTVKLMSPIRILFNQP